MLVMTREMLQGFDSLTNLDRERREFPVRVILCRGQFNARLDKECDTIFCAVALPYVRLVHFVHHGIHHSRTRHVVKPLFLIFSNSYEIHEKA